jgi:hypothetical protein
LNDIKHSGLKYGSNKLVDQGLRDIEYVEHDRLKIDRFECSDHEKCMERVFTESDTTFVATTFQAQYVASRIGKTSDKKQLCSLDENVFPSIIVMYFRQGHPVIDSFNIVISRCIEAGLVDKYWSDLHSNLTLQNMRKLGESDCKVCSDGYFVFSLTHLRVIFIILGFGYLLSVVVFVAELICKWLSKRWTVTVSKHKKLPFAFLH